MIVGLFPELLNFGGVQLAGREIAATLSVMAEEQGVPFHALSLNDSKGKQESSIGCLKFRFDGFGRNKIWFLLAALRTARAHPRIILAAHPNVSPVAAALRTLAGESRVIVCAHGIEVWRPLSLIRRKALRRADLVLAPSSDTAHKLSEHQGVVKEKIRALSWPLDPDFLALADAPERLPFSENLPRGLVVLTVGRWSASERYKGVDLLIRAVAELAEQFTDLHLALAGSGDDVPRLQNLAKSSNCAGRVHFLTCPSREALAACYAMADIFALPSSGEGFGFVFLEAMAMKKPVIGAARGGITDIIQDGETGFLVDPEKPASIVSALRKLLSYRDLRQKLGERGSTIVRQQYSFEGFQRKLRSLLCEQIRN